MAGSIVHNLMTQDNAKDLLAKLGQDFLTDYLGELQIQTSENGSFTPNQVGSKVVQALELESKKVGNIYYIATAPLQLSDLEGFCFAIIYDLLTA